MTNKTYVWLAKVGNLYYATGLHTPDVFDAKAYCLTDEEDLAFMFEFEEVAERIAKDLGGITIKKDVTGKYANLSTLNEMLKNEIS